MTETKWDHQLEELKNMPKQTVHAPEVLMLITDMFTEDFNKSVKKSLHCSFWKALKVLISDMTRSSPKDKTLAQNTYGLAIGYLSDLSVIVHSTYNIPNMSMPGFLTALTFNDCKNPKKEGVLMSNARLFNSTIMARMGDLMRYKGHTASAIQFYELSLKINPTNGETYCNLGKLYRSGAQWLKSAYYLSRAVHSSIPNQDATQYLASIFKKFANRDTSKSIPIDELFIATLAKLHFLMEIEGGEKHLKKLGEHMANSKEMIVSLMAVYDDSATGTELESRAVDAIEIIWKQAFETKFAELKKKTTITDEDLQIIGLLLRSMEFCPDYDDELITKIRECDIENVQDEYRFDHFKCSMFPSLSYPLTTQKIINCLKGDESIDETTIDDEDENGSIDSRRSGNLSNMRTPSSLTRNVDEESEEEELLVRGTRRMIVRGHDDGDSFDEEDDNDDDV